MKKYIILSLLSFYAIACTDLDVVPKTDLLPAVVFSEESSYTAYLAKLYAAMSQTGQEGPHGNGDLSIIQDEGFSSYIRAYWKGQELTTDEAVIRWTDAGIPTLNTHAWSSENQFIRVLYYRIFFLVALTNDFLGVSTPAEMSANGISAEFQEVVKTYRAEARFIRALAYWHALDMYRNVPIIKEVSSNLPTQSKGKAVYNFILDELNDIEADMVDARQNEYGRADKGALWALRAKLRLNAPVYLDEGDGALDNIYNDVVTDLESIINAGYSLTPVYSHLFGADNHISNEIIFALNQDGINTRSWGATTFLVQGCIFPATMTDSDYGVTGGWSGIAATKQFVELFETSPNVLDTVDSRLVFFTTGRSKDITNLDSLQSSEEIGYAVPKFTNLTSGGSAGSHGTHVDTDYPMFRLADAYLMYAEAVLRGATNGDIGTAVGYVNEILERGYGDATHNITSGDLDLDEVLFQRSRELYYEAHRRTDLIRFNKFSDRAGADEMMWDLKGNADDGASSPAFYEIFPIPASDLNANKNLKQNFGY